MVAMHSRRRLCLDRSAQIAHDEVDLDSARQAPIGELLEAAAVCAPCDQLVMDPVLERLSEQLGAGLDPTAARQYVHDRDVAEVELRGCDRAALRPARPGGEKPPQQRVDEDLEVFANRRR
jgi:hypothetical protein